MFLSSSNLRLANSAKFVVELCGCLLLFCAAPPASSVAARTVHDAVVGGGGEIAPLSLPLSFGKEISMINFWVQLCTFPISAFSSSHMCAIHAVRCLCLEAMGFQRCPKVDNCILAMVECSSARLAAAAAWV